MSRFSGILSGAAARMRVPEPARSRVLLEVAADMDDLFEAYLGRGMAPDEAQEAVAEQFDLSDEVLLELARVHDTPLQRSLESISGQVRGGWSRGLLGLLALTVAVGSGRLLFQPQLYRDASPLVWILLGLLLLGLGIGLWKALRLFGGKQEWSPALEKRLGYLLGLSILEMSLAFAGSWIELYRAVLRTRAGSGQATVQVVGWVYSTSATLVVALTAAVLLGSLWFFLVIRVRQMEESAAASLLEEAS